MIPLKVLLISSNTLPAAPTGPVYVAGAARAAGHEVRIYERLFANDLEGELSCVLVDFLPDVIGISIRLVFGDELDGNAPLGTRHTDLRPRVKQITNIVRQNTDARIILGGPGFNYYARDWLEYLNLDYGICGEGEEAFPLFLERSPREGMSTRCPDAHSGGMAATMPFRLTWSRILTGRPFRLMTCWIGNPMLLRISPQLSLPSAGVPFRAPIAPTASWKASVTA